MLGSEKISALSTPPTPPPVKTGPTVKKDQGARFHETANEFEATFLSMLLKEMRQTLEPDGGLFPGDSGDVQGGLFDLLLGSHLAQAGGVGLATALVRQMQATQPAKAVSPNDALDPRTRDSVSPAPRS